MCAGLQAASLASHDVAKVGRRRITLARYEASDTQTSKSKRADQSARASQRACQPLLSLAQRINQVELMPPLSDFSFTRSPAYLHPSRRLFGGFTNKFAPAPRSPLRVYVDLSCCCCCRRRRRCCCCFYISKYEMRSVEKRSNSRQVRELVKIQASRWIRGKKENPNKKSNFYRIMLLAARG